MRLFFVDFAEKQGLDPLNPETWYHVKRSKIEAVVIPFHPSLDSSSSFPSHSSYQAGGSSIMWKFRGGFAKALQTMFPDIGLDMSKFGDHTKPSM
jgi:hypothetical protein